MSELVTINDLYLKADSYADQMVRIAGWVRTNRDQKRFGFMTISDGSHFTPVQVVYATETLANYEDTARCGTGASVIVEGKMVLTPGAKQPLEIQAVSVRIEGDSPPDYPLQPKRHTPEFMRSIAHLRPRANLYNAVFKVRSKASFSIHKFFNERDFVYVHTPIITANDAEGAGEMFHVTNLDLDNIPRNPDATIDYRKDFFGKKTSLTVSGQLNGEAFAQAFGKIYTFGPTFRAEHSNTARHAAEFWMIEPEIAFADLNDNMRLAEDMLKYVIRDIMRECPAELEFFNRFVDKDLLKRLEHVVSSDFATVSYTDAVRELEKVNDRFDFKVSWGCDLQTEHERYLTEHIFNRPVFVTDYPAAIKAFYMRLNDDGKTVAAMDCLVPGVGEIIGGSQREERLENLRQRMTELGLPIENYEWYLDLRRYGTTKHAGFGLGFERMIMYLTGVTNIRDVLPFPRTTGSAMF
ncbi:MAG: asparagine--tRNA ligase [Fastidiosipilaceae bacterium]